MLASHLPRTQGSAKETEQVVQIGKKRNWNCQYSTNTSKDMKAVQTQQVKEAGEDEILQASGEAGNILDCIADIAHDVGLELDSIEAAQLTEKDYPCTDLLSESALEGGCGCHPMCPDGQQAHYHSYEHFLPESQPVALDIDCSGEIWCSHQGSYMLKASLSSEDTHMTWTEDSSTPSSGHLIDEYYCNTNNSYNEESDQDVFLSPDIATSGSTAILSHYDPLGAAARCSDGYEKLHGDNSTEKMTCDENSSNTTAQALRHLDDILRDKVNLEFDECRRSLQGILDKNLDHVQHLLRLHNSPDIQDFKMDAQATGMKDTDVDAGFGVNADFGVDA
ncbi:hypothetical protein LSAT2_022960 [Lamellibrachia satsuma]|nr:hypothetical protein LSAT2_022960 [Lamellibrachia satsuma]